MQFYKSFSRKCNYDYPNYHLGTASFKICFLKKKVRDLKIDSLDRVIRAELSKLSDKYSLKKKEYQAGIDFKADENFDSWVNSKGRGGYTLEIKISVSAKKVLFEDDLTSILEKLNLNKEKTDLRDPLCGINKEVFKDIINLGKELTKDTDEFYRSIYKVTDFFSEVFPPISERKLCNFYDFDIASSALHREISDSLDILNPSEEKVYLPKTYGFIGSGKHKQKIVVVNTDILGKKAILLLQGGIDSSTYTDFDNLAFLPDLGVNNLKDYYVRIYDLFEKGVAEHSFGIIQELELAPVFGLVRKERADKRKRFPQDSMLVFARKIVDQTDENFLKDVVLDNNLELFVRLAATCNLTVNALNETYAKTDPFFKELIKRYYGKDDQSLRFIKGYDF